MANKEIDPNDPFGGKDDNSLEPPEYAPAFRFEDVGDAISGEVSSISVRAQSKWGPYPIIELTGCTTRVKGKGKTPKTETQDSAAIHAFHTVLRTKLAEENIQIGETVRIFRVEDGESEKHGAYRNFRVVLPNRPKVQSVADVLATHPEAFKTDQD